ncbi:hypothetical protein D0C36_07995 [Mucilaginibacter conchicola]|uniref:DoxX family membrane protein n=1 Tax=Mucilaginibacter conchicola TaxID=2303333 RepID=A0A372NZK6_9SPHI|nr:hypothetical protein [Mucilaginibacter conchicola]RFZ95452.1 hypothetical protein D0C36_07995 [Mucilaginibacter conchicola]
MKDAAKPWRLLFALSIIGIALQQLILSVYMPVILPWPDSLVMSVPAVWTGSIFLLVLAGLMLTDKLSHNAAIDLGAVFLALCVLSHLPFQLKLTPFFFGNMTNVFKLIALSGCSLIVASAVVPRGEPHWMAKLISAGPYLLALTMMVFGVMHFMYADFVKNLIPLVFGKTVLWVYLTGVALFAAGLAIAINVKRRLAARLLGIMVLIWAVFLHLPRAFADPRSGYGNEIVSVFEAFAFSAGAFTLAVVSKVKKAVA